MKIKIINKYQIKINNQTIFIEFSGTKKELEQYIREDKAIGKGIFRPIRMLSRIKNEGYYINYI